MWSGSFEGDAVPWGGFVGPVHSAQGDLSAAAPQVVEDGYEFFAKRQLVTLFSAPNYCGEFDNAGAMMSVDETLMCSFQVSQGFAGEAAARRALPAAPPLTLFPADSETGRQEQGQVWAVQWAEPRWPPCHPATQLCESQEVSARHQQPQHQVAPLSICFFICKILSPLPLSTVPNAPSGAGPAPWMAVESGQEAFLGNKLVMGLKMWVWDYPAWPDSASCCAVASEWGLSALSIAVLCQYLLAGGWARPPWCQHRTKKQRAELGE